MSADTMFKSWPLFLMFLFQYFQKKLILFVGFLHKTWWNDFSVCLNTFEIFPANFNNTVYNNLDWYII